MATTEVMSLITDQDDAEAANQRTAELVTAEADATRACLAMVHQQRATADAIAENYRLRAEYEQLLKEDLRASIEALTAKLDNKKGMTP